MDQGLSTLSGLASVLDYRDDELNLEENEIDKIAEMVPDPLGTFYRYSFGSALINEVVEDVEE